MLKKSCLLPYSFMKKNRTLTPHAGSRCISDDAYSFLDSHLKKKGHGLLVALALFVSPAAHAAGNHVHNKDASDHAPIGVMGDHNHKEGEWMLSYRYSQMYMKGNRDGDSRVTPGDVLGDFMVAPLKMRMEMHMFGLMYGASDDLTLMVMAPYALKTMDHINRSGVDFRTTTEGLGDVKVSGLYTLYETQTQRLLANLGVSLPTGSVDERGDTPAGNNQKLPYPMQLGSGTFDPLLGLTYSYDLGSWSLGSQAHTTLRFGDNSEGYRLGNEYTASAWVAKDVAPSTSVSFRLEGKSWGDIHGQDSDLNANMVPTARTDLRGGERLDAFLGVNFLQSDGVLAGHRLGAEFGMPVYQRLDGPQLETDYRLTLGWQLAF